MSSGFEHRAGVDIFVPGGRHWREALARVTHLGIGAHADDLEFMAFAGIAECQGGAGVFGGVTVTDGGGSVGGAGDLVAVRRDLDWLTGNDRVRLDCGRDGEFAAKLNAVFRSQIDGGKRYDLAVMGRRRAQATFDEPRLADAAEMVTLAMDLTPLIEDDSLSLRDFAAAKIDRFREDVLRRLA